MLELKNISKRYSAPGGMHETVVLSDITMSVSAGDSVAIVGPSGSGKSTLLNIIGTLDKASSGNLYFNNQDVTQLSETETASFRNKNLGFVFQQHHLLPQCNVLENVLLPTLVSPGAEKNERAKELLDMVGLSEHMAHLPAQLSGGEQQRVAVVRAMINNPELILADEPTGSLDQDNSEKLCDLLVNLNTDNSVTLIVVTHSSDLAAKMKTKYRINKGCLENYKI